MIEVRVYDVLRERYVTQEDYRDLRSAYVATKNNTLRFGCDKQIFEISTGIRDDEGVMIFESDIVSVLISEKYHTVLVRKLYGGLGVVINEEFIYFGRMSRASFESLHIKGNLHGNHHIYNLHDL